MVARLGDILIDEGILSEAQLTAGMREKPRHILLGDWLMQRGDITRPQLGHALSRQFEVPYQEIDTSAINPQIIRLLPEKFARTRKILPIAIERRSLRLAMLAPDDIETIAEVELMTGYSVEPVIAQEADLLQAIDRGYDGRSVARQTIVDMKLAELAKLDVEEVIVDAELIEDEEAPVVRLVQGILEGAVDAGASDIHLEPHQPEMRVRYRVDGQLQQIMTIPTHIESAVVARIKVMAEMNTTETRRAQDGHLAVVENSKRVNFRVSSVPTVGGEKLVLRLLDEGSKSFSLEQLGILEHDRQRLQKIIDRPHGMFIVTGPTGSGKTTTLYAVLSLLNAIHRNIVTVEDPVEYRLPGINQIQNNNDFGLGFANALKYIMRQDPDVIMVGEIRDHETATVAVQAALTGHLLISTLHTNDAPSAVTRLNDLGVDYFKLAGALVGSIAQRLLRKLCPHCKQPTQPAAELVARLGVAKEVVANSTFYRAVGCGKCLNTGYAGRLPIFEIMSVGGQVLTAIERGLPVSKIRELAIEDGMTELLQAGLHQAVAGHTTLDEVYFKTMN
ncbi:MAG: Flp pilus assembly complex ATPase component TadA [Planctomycetales bacterium]|nr:Flp pilus assembly complex ATPase component TadA [Planctomycetales bacterium]